MHGIVTAGNLTRAQQEANARLMDEAASYTAYSYWIPASEWLYQSGTVVLVAPSTTNPPYWQFYEGQAARLGAYVRRHREWRNGYFIANMHWSSLAGKNVDVRWNLSIDPVPMKPTSATFPTISPQGFTLTAITVGTIIVDELSSASLNALSRITPKHSGIMVSIGKEANTAADTSTVDREFYGLELIYVEKGKQTGSYNT